MDDYRNIKQRMFNYLIIVIKNYSKITTAATLLNDNRTKPIKFKDVHCILKNVL